MVCQTFPQLTIFPEFPFRLIRFQDVKEVQAIQGFLQDHLQEIRGRSLPLW